jgi:predicted nucleotidyltransferase
MPTALELTPEEWKSYFKALPENPSAPPLPPELQKERMQLLEGVRQAAAMLKTRFGVKRVILFGSLAHESWFFPRSDVDLATVGLRGEHYWQAWKSVEEIIKDRPVDLLEIDDASESLRRAIERSGLEL